MKKILFLFFVCNLCFAQTKAQTLSLNECIALALKNNEAVRTGKLEIEQAKQTAKGYIELPKTAVVYTQGQFNSAYKYDNSFAVTQGIPFPSVFSSNKAMTKALVKEMEFKTAATESDLIYQVKSCYYSLQYHYAIHDLLLKEDSIYQSFLIVQNQKFAEGKSSILEKSAAEAKALEVNTLLLENTEEIVSYAIQLQTLMHLSTEIKIKQENPEQILVLLGQDTAGIESNSYLLFLEQQIEVSKKNRLLEKARYLPDFTVGYFNLSIYGPANIGNGEYFLTTRNRLSGFTVGANIPLWFYPFKVKLASQKIHSSILQSNYDYNKTMFAGELKQNLTMYAAYRKSIDFRKKGILTNSDQIFKQAITAFSKNEINYVDYLTIVSNALNTESNYLGVLYKCNLAALRVQYLLKK